MPSFDTHIDGWHLALATATDILIQNEHVVARATAWAAASPRVIFFVTCQSRGGLCRSNLHPVCQAQMEHDMNIDDVPAMMLCSNCLCRATGDKWNDDEAAGILQEAEGGITDAGSAGILAEAITTHGAWRNDRTFNMYLSD